MRVRCPTTSIANAQEASLAIVVNAVKKSVSDGMTLTGEECHHLRWSLLRTDVHAREYPHNQAHKKQFNSLALSSAAQSCATIRIAAMPNSINTQPMKRSRPSPLGFPPHLTLGRPFSELRQLPSPQGGAPTNFVNGTSLANQGHSCGIGKENLLDILNEVLAMVEDEEF